jgi:hypothetical protein
MLVTAHRKRGPRGKRSNVRDKGYSCQYSIATACFGRYLLHCIMVNGGGGDTWRWDRQVKGSQMQ